MSTQFVNEASTLGLAPGYWPRTLVVDSVTFTAKAKRTNREGELEAVIYSMIENPDVTMIVLND